jgi:carbon starvation protein
MNSLVVVVIAVVSFWWGLKFYATRLEGLWNIDSKKSTPAFSKFDSVDYIPAKNWLVLFGHHFASIAGAGPIIGPVIACILWGWLPALVWIILGSVFIGGVHDFSSLITSVREGGNSVADIAKGAISKRAKLIFSLFVLLALILVIAVFAYLSADTFVKDPKIVLPSLGTIPLAVVVGLLLYRYKMNPLLITILALAALTILILLGNIYPLTLGKHSIHIWLSVLIVYSYLASILPVNILLQPRDYISSMLLFIGIGLGFLGLLFSRPTLSTPFYSQWSSQAGYLWPALFVTVACGAVSGFHTLIASGTTSKQLPNERFAKRIGYGSMLTEGILAVLAVIAVSSIFKSHDSAVSALKALGPIGLFSQGYAAITDVILKGWGGFLAIIILNAFILTTLDSATRICRYITEELFSIKNRFISTFVILFFSGILAFSGKWAKIWPVFGASNQLVAALSLFVVSCWLLSRKKTIKFTLPVGIFMLITTLAALVFQVIRFYAQKDYILLSVNLVLIILSLIMTTEVMGKIYSKREVGL